MLARRWLSAFIAGAFTLPVLTLPGAAAGADKYLYKLKGAVGYAAQCNPAAFNPLATGIVLTDSTCAVTREGQGYVILPDSSEVDLGANTTVALGAFNAVTGTTVDLRVGSLKFHVSHPKAQKSNYTFTTPVSQTAVRGTVGLIATDPQAGDTIGCLRCEVGDVTVTIKQSGQKVSLLTGQALRIAVSGALIAGVTTVALSSVLGGSTFASVPGASSASSVAAGGAGAGGAGAGGAAAGSAGAAAGASGAAIAGAAAAVAVGAAAISNSNAKTPAPAQSAPAPAPSGTGVPFIFQAPPGNRTVQAAPTPSPSPKPSAKSGGR